MWTTAITSALLVVLLLMVDLVPWGRFEATGLAQKGLKAMFALFHLRT